MARIPKQIEGDWPKLNIKALPREERRAAQNLQSLFHLLFFLGRDFVSAVSLFDHAMAEMAKSHILGKESNAEQWLYVAARDGAVTLNNFGKLLVVVADALRECPTILAMTDVRTLRAARRLMKQHFPGYESIRHGVGHSAELTRNVAKRTKHSLRNVALAGWGTTVETITIRNWLDGRQFQNTFEGKLHTYEVSQKSVRKLDEVRLAFYSAFRRAELELAAKS